MYSQPQSLPSHKDNRTTTPLSICSSVASFQSDSYSPTTDPEPQGLSPTPALRPLASFMEQYSAGPPMDNYRRPSIHGDDAAEIASLPPMNEGGAYKRRRERRNSDVSMVFAATPFSTTESQEKPSTACNPLRKKLSLQTSLDQFPLSTTQWSSRSGRDTPSSTTSTLYSPYVQNLDNLRQRADFNCASPSSVVSSFSASTLYSNRPPSNVGTEQKLRTSNVSVSDFDTSPASGCKTTTRSRRATASATTGGRLSRALTSYSGQTVCTTSSSIATTLRNRPGFCSHNSYNNPYQTSFSSPPSLISSPTSLRSPSPKTADSALDPHKIFGTSSIDWKSPESRRREYEEADRKRKGLWNWVRKRLLCGGKIGNGIGVDKVEFWEEGGREGSVRRYRLDLPPKEEGNTVEDEAGVDGVEWGWDGR
ncbi:hypothetical protein RUND412_007977 [Rhizina undulata]